MSVFADPGPPTAANRFIIDILNDSVVDTLPDEGWEMLNHYLHDDHLDAKI